MLLIAEILLTIFLFFYYIFEAILKWFIPNSWQKKDVHGETVLITGAGSGIGRLLAYRFARLGSILVLWDINKEGNEATAAEIRKRGGTAYTYHCDISKREEVYEIANKVRRDIGHVTILVNNAGIVTGKKFLELPDNMIQKTMDVNAMAHFWTLKAFLPSMVEHNHGHIVSIASIAGMVGVNGVVEYCASKFAAVGLDEALRFELDVLDKPGIHTTVVCPYFISTGMFEGCQSRFQALLPALEPEYVADKVVEAVQINQKILLIPRLLYVIMALKGVVPFSCLMLLCKMFGSEHAMDTYIGRRNLQKLD